MSQNLVSYSIAHDIYDVVLMAIGDHTSEMITSFALEKNIMKSDLNYNKEIKHRVQYCLIDPIFILMTRNNFVCLLVYRCFQRNVSDFESVCVSVISKSNDRSSQKCLETHDLWAVSWQFFAIFSSILI